MRAAHVRENLKTLDAFSDELASEVRARLRPELVEVIENAPRSAWLPLQHDIELSAKVAEVGGYEMCMQWCRSSLEATAQTPLLRGFFSAGLRLFGANPGHLLRLVQRGYPTIYRDAGSMTCEPLRDDAVRIRGHDLPRMLLDDKLYLEGIGESISIVPYLVKYEASSTLEVDGDQVSWVISWWKPKG